MAGSAARAVRLFSPTRGNIPVILKNVGPRPETPGKAPSMTVMPYTFGVTSETKKFPKATNKVDSAGKRDLRAREQDRPHPCGTRKCESNKVNGNFGKINGKNLCIYLIGPYNI